PAPKGPGSVRRMGEGLGGWGHATRRVRSTVQTLGGSWLGRNFFRGLLAGVAPAAGGRTGAFAFARVGRQRDLPSIRKLKVTQIDMPAAAFDDVAGADREPARKSSDARNHGNG